MLQSWHPSQRPLGRPALRRHSETLGSGAGTSSPLTSSTVAETSSVIAFDTSGKSPAYWQHRSNRQPAPETAAGFLLSELIRSDGGAQVSMRQVSQASPARRRPNHPCFMPARANASARGVASMPRPPRPLDFGDRVRARNDRADRDLPRIYFQLAGNRRRHAQDSDGNTVARAKPYEDSHQCACRRDAFKGCDPRRTRFRGQRDPRSWLGQGCASPGK
jgi:hypothetical protein